MRQAKITPRRPPQVGGTAFVRFCLRSSGVASLPQLGINSPAYRRVLRAGALQSRQPDCKHR